MTLAFPAAVFGKTETNNSFGIQFRTAGFPDAAANELQDLSRQIQWKGAGRNPHPPCFALCPVPEGGGCLVTRISDSGFDKFGRFHTLQIEAAYLDRSTLQKHAAILHQLLHPEVWPQMEWTDSTSGIHLTPSTAGSPSFSDQIRVEAGTRRILINLNDHIESNQWFDQIIDSGIHKTRSPVAPRDDSIMTRSTASSSPLPPPMGSVPEKTLRISWTGTLLFLLLAGLVACGGYHIHQQNQRIAELEQETRRLAGLVDKNTTEREVPRSQQPFEDSLIQWLREEDEITQKRLNSLNQLLQQLSLEPLQPPQESVERDPIIQTENEFTKNPKSDKTRGRTWTWPK